MGRRYGGGLVGMFGELSSPYCRGCLGMVGAAVGLLLIGGLGLGSGFVARILSLERG